jgi:hypothetical protein
MLRIICTSVRGFDIDSLTVSWEIDPIDKVAFDINNYEFRVYRSSSPEGPFDLLTKTPLVDQFSYEDTTINRRSFWRKFYYKIEALDLSSNNTTSSIVHRAEVSPTLASQMLIGLEIARRERLLLGGAGTTPGFVGVRCAAFVRRTFGQHCAECWDDLLERKVSDKCTRCFGASYVGGYYDPIATYFNFNPSPQTSQIANFGEIQSSEADCWTTNYPLLSPGDLIIEPNNRRWRVQRVHMTEMLRVPIRQMVRLMEINRSDVEYLIPVDDSLFDLLNEDEYNELLSNKTEFEEIKR